MKTLIPALTGMAKIPPQIMKLATPVSPTLTRPHRERGQTYRCAIFALTLALFSIAAQADELTIPRAAGTVMLDGSLQEPAWRYAMRLPHTAFSRWIADTYIKDPNIFHLRLFHDGNTLYVALVSYDQHVEADKTVENSDGLYSFSILTRNGELQHYRLRWASNPPVAGGEMLDPGKWGARLRGPYNEPAIVSGGYVFEFSIPLAAIGWKPGDNIPFNIIVHDHDGNPSQPYNAPGVEFARYSWGSLENDNRAGYRTLKLAP
jgi:hypothetical protein